MWNLNSKIIILGLVIQALVLVAMFFTKNTIVWCSEKNYGHSSSTLEINHAENASLRTAVAGAECNTVIELKPEHHAA